MGDHLASPLLAARGKVQAGRWLPLLSGWSSWRGLSPDHGGGREQAAALLETHFTPVRSTAMCSTGSGNKWKSNKFATLCPLFQYLALIKILGYSSGC